MPKPRSVRPESLDLPGMTHSEETASTKEGFDIDRVMERLREGVATFRKAALFELYEEGYTTPFEQLLACLISIRTRDEDTVPISMLNGSTFREAKAPQILELSRQIVAEHGGELPCDLETLLAFRGVGIKCAHLVLGIACGQPRIGVDIHVHRITNRWGYVATTSPEKTTAALEQLLPKTYWVKINALLVPFGKHVCTGVAPRCSTCPLLTMCEQVGVTSHR